MRILLQDILQVIKEIIYGINIEDYNSLIERRMDYKKEMKLVSNIIATIYSSFVYLLEEDTINTKIYFPYLEKRYDKDNEIYQILNSLKYQYSDMWVLFNQISKDTIKMIMASNENDMNIFKNNKLRNLFIFNYIEIHKKDGNIDLYVTLIDDDKSELLIYKLKDYMTFYSLGILVNLKIKSERNLPENITIPEIETEIGYLNDDKNYKLLFYKIADFIVNP